MSTFEGAGPDAGLPQSEARVRIGERLWLISPCAPDEFDDETCRLDCPRIRLVRAYYRVSEIDPAVNVLSLEDIFALPPWLRSDQRRGSMRRSSKHVKNPRHQRSQIVEPIAASDEHDDCYVK